MNRDLTGLTQTSVGKPTAESPTAAISIWLVVQALAIAIAAFRIPLWIHSPDATEYIALPILFSVQISAAAMLSPRLCQDIATTLIAIATAWPFVVAADFLATVPQGPVFWVGGYVSAWLASLGLLQHSLRPNGRLMAAGLLGAWCAAGPVLLIFMRNERNDGSLPILSDAMRSAMGPLTSGMPLVDASGHYSLWHWAAMATIAALGGGIEWGKHAMMRHRAVAHQTAS